MSRKMEHLKNPVAKVDDVTIINCFGQGRGLITPIRNVKSVIGQLFYCPWFKQMSHCCLACWIGKNVSLGSMSKPRLELTQAARMIVVAVRTKRNDWPFSQHHDVFGDWAKTEARVNYQITIPAPHMPNIASPISGNMCLQNTRHTIIKRPDPVPA